MERDLADTEPLADVRHLAAGAELGFRFPQLPNDLVRRVSLSFHRESLLLRKSGLSQRLDQEYGVRPSSPDTRPLDQEVVASRTAGAPADLAVRAPLAASPAPGKSWASSTRSAPSPPDWPIRRPASTSDALGMELSALGFRQRMTWLPRGEALMDAAAGRSSPVPRAAWPHRSSFRSAQGGLVHCSRPTRST